jgi:hypothetical protein
VAVDGRGRDVRASEDKSNRLFSRTAPARVRLQTHPENGAI